MKAIIKYLLSAAIVAPLATAASAQQMPVATDWATKTIPTEVFGQFEQLNRPRLSPDGKWIAAMARVNKRQALVLLAVGQAGVPMQMIGFSQEAAVDKQGDRQIESWRWLNPTTLLIEFSSRDNYAGQWLDIARYAAYNINTKKIVPLGWDKAFQSTDVLWASNTGRPHVLMERHNLDYGTEMARHPEVIDIDVETGAEHVVVKPNAVVDGWEADEAGIVRFGSSYDPDTGKLRVVYRPDANSDFKTLVSVKETGRDTDLQIPTLILANNQAYSINSRSGYAALYEYDLSAMKVGKQVFAVDGYDIGGTLRSFDRQSLEGVVYESDRTHQVFFSPRMKEISGLLEETYGKGNVLIESADAQQDKILFSAAAPGQVPSYWLFDTKTGGLGRLAWGNDALKNAMLNPVSTIHYQTTDSKTVEAVLTMPRHRAGQKDLPLIVMPHGGPWARDSMDWDPYQWAQAMAELGYVVIQPNYRGSTGYGRAWTKAADKNWGYRMQDDLIDAISYLAQQHIADPKRVCIMGWSYGGYAASRAAQRDGAHYRCAISGAGPTDIPAMVRYDTNYLGTQRAKAALGSAGDLVDVSPALHAADYSIPILIVHGAKDQRVPVAQSRNLVARLKAAGKVEGRDFVYIEQPNNTQNLLHEEDRVQFLEEARKFLEKYNPA